MALATVEIITAPGVGEDTSSTQHDPLRYGWRYIRHDLDDGSFTLDQVPLTLEAELQRLRGEA